MQCQFEVKRFISETSMIKICETVKTYILEWALNLEKKGVLGEGINFAEEDKKIAHSGIPAIYNNTTNLFLGDVIQSNVTNSQNFHVEKGDKDSLREVLIKYEIANEDIDELISTIDIDSKSSSPEKFSEKVRNWISKAAKGTLNITADVASKMITQAITQYYGL